MLSLSLSVVGPNWSCVLCNKVQNRLARIEEFRLKLGQDSSWQYSKNVVGKKIQTMNHLLAFEFDQELKLIQVTGVPQVHGFFDGGEQAYGCSHFPSTGVKRWS